MNQAILLERLIEYADSLKYVCQTYSDNQDTPEEKLAALQATAELIKDTAKKVGKP